MKRKDLALIIFVAGVAGILSVIVSNLVFASASNKTQSAEVVDAVTTEFVKPSEKYFNANSIDPTLLIQIGGGTNANPFGSQ